MNALKMMPQLYDISPYCMLFGGWFLKVGVVSTCSKEKDVISPFEIYSNKSIKFKYSGGRDVILF